MLVSLNWLKNYVDFGSISPEELAEKITKSGIEVDGIDYFAQKSTGVVVGYVTSCIQHPNADRLRLCQVDVGDEELQIICGAPNVAQGQKVAVAKPGAVLPGDFKIKKVKLRGVESNGMICSLQELGIKDEYIPTDIAKGIFVFPEDTPVGEDVESFLNLNDTILEFDLTPNRADCLSMIGVAYEVAALLDIPVKLPDETVKTVDEDTADYVTVEVENPELNPYYGAFVVKNINIKPSPLWMRNYLMAAGIRPINNVVDITNFVLLEYGQPLHAFDYDRLETKKIVVRTAHDKETIVTLDGKERQLKTDDLVITDGQVPIALAGVMGSANTEVYEGTKNVLIEAAYFNPLSVRKTAQATGLRSEASTRFEKGIDPSRVKKAGIRACQLLQQYADGEVLEGAVEFDELTIEEKTVEMDTEHINKRLGTNISQGEIESILERLGFKYEVNNGHFIVTVPTRRGDISIFEDMLEEVARIYGYDQLPFTLPENSSRIGGLTEKQLLKRKIKQFLQGAGLTETITYSLTNESLSQKLLSPEVAEKNVKAIKLSMPMSEDHQYLRLSILPELLRTVSYNHARKETNIAYYEVGSVFLTDEDVLTKQPHEQLRLSGVLTGSWLDHKWQQGKKEVDFYVVKGIVDGLFKFLELPVTYQQTKMDDMHPGRCAILSVNDDVIGFIGQLHPAFANELDLKEVYVFDINLEFVLNRVKNEPTYRSIPRYPSITRDIAFIVDDHIHAGDIKAVIEDAGSALVRNVDIFDVYKGENLEEGKKSIAYSLHFQHSERTLKDDEVDELYNDIVNQVNERFGSFVRS